MGSVASRKRCKNVISSYPQKSSSPDNHRGHAEHAIGDRLISLLSQLRFACGLLCLSDQPPAVELDFGCNFLNDLRLRDMHAAHPNRVKQRVNQPESLVRVQLERRNAKRQKRIEGKKHRRVQRHAEHGRLAQNVLPHPAHLRKYFGRPQLPVRFEQARE